MDKKMEHDMETGLCRGSTGFMECRGLTNYEVHFEVYLRFHP